MKLTALLLSILFSGSLAFAHCGSCGTGDANKGEKASCSKSKHGKKHHKGDKHAKGESCACDKNKKKEA